MANKQEIKNLVSRIFKRDNALKKLSLIVNRKPTAIELLNIRLLILFGIIAMSFFLLWFFQPERKGISFLYWILTIALLFKLARWLHEWYHYFSISYPEQPKTSEQKRWKVDILTTFCPGEPYQMVVDTLEAIVQIRYPHTTYLCDEGDTPYLKKKCEELGVIHVTRSNKINAKAGNINNALKQATGEICVILDPDHKPVPHFLDTVLPYFDDPAIGFVQVVQAYGNQAESLVALGAAQQTYQFYGPLMMGMNSYGTTQAIGANCTFRRKALDSIGGHAPGLSEDMHTAMRLHGAGWKSVYIPEVLTIGLTPASMSAYLKQQLKWSRGTFELLFFTFPALFMKFTWRQRIHYFTIALYFMSGLITLFDILVPVLALLLAVPVWKIELNDFIAMIAPVMGLAYLVRIYSQRWLAQESERGLHLIGGILRMATWWIFLLGFICTLLRIKIPYIPTPKDDKPENEWVICLPNIIAAIICILSIPIGLQLDWSPFSVFMAGFAFLNAVLLIFATLMGQQKLIIQISAGWRRLKKRHLTFLQAISLKKFNFNALFAIIRKSALIPGLFFFIFALGNQYRLQFSTPEYRLQEIMPPVKKNTGGFYTGIYIPEIEKKGSFENLDQTEKRLNTHFDIVSIYMAWGPGSGSVFPDSLMQEIHRRKSIPLLTWEPWTWPFPEYRQTPDLCCEKKVLQYITKGFFDKYLNEYANRIKKLKAPVMIRFAHEFDNPAYPWSEAGGNSPKDFISSWRYVVNYFDSMGVGNVAWVWNPWEEDNMDKYYPGDEYVDWIGVTNLNYGLAASNNTWYEMEGLYHPFSEKVKKYNKPVMLTEFGSTTFGGNQAKWIAGAFNKIRNNYPEVKALVFFYSNNDPNWGFTSWRPADSSKTINWTFDSHATVDTVTRYLHLPYFNNHPLLVQATTPPKQNYEPEKPVVYLKGTPGNFQLMVDGRPFYIKGIAYNQGQDWRDGNIPLSRSKLLEDFQKIKELGANTIRRYDPGFYDHNILKVASEKNLKVLYGFWFEQQVDYSTNEKIMDQYAQKVEQAVIRFRNEPAVLGWCIGNEVWGLSKQYFAQPYLFGVRENYVKFIEKLARRIHELDPNRPVFVAEEHTSKLPAAIESFRDGAPSVDVFGINSYYHKHLSRLQHEYITTDPNRPYLVSEFGPEGYWQPDFTNQDASGAVIEDGGERKAYLYERRWIDLIEPFKGSNIGGIAYCWSDRLEGTATWFGLSDNKGRLKPAYNTLQKLWAGKQNGSPIGEVYIFAPVEASKPGNAYSFFAITEKSGLTKLQYEWYLCKDEFVVTKYKVETTDDGRKARVTIPDEPSHYRLYVNISDKKGYCNTASYPLPAYRKK